MSKWQVATIDVILVLKANYGIRFSFLPFREQSDRLLAVRIRIRCRLFVFEIIENVM